MPKIRNYEVSQTRKVKVTANSPVDAIRIADVAFNEGQDANGKVVVPEDVWGNTTSAISTVDMSCYEEN